MVFKPRHSGFLVASSVEQDNGRYAYLDDVEDGKRVFLVYASCALLPLALYDEIVGKPVLVEYENVALSRAFIDTRTARHLLGVLFSPYALAVRKELRPRAYELGIAVVL